MRNRARTAAALACLLLIAHARADEEKSTELEAAVERVITEAPDMVVTATQTRRDPFELPQSIRVFGRDEVQDVGGFVALKTISRRDAGIWYDERTTTTTDPIIRGFAGFNLLTLVDGNTLTTLWGEGGFGADDMYGKIDPETVERIEVIRGPNSALYGSNALGAVINVITRVSPIDYTEGDFRSGLRTKFGFESAPNAGSVRTEVYGATDSFKFLLGGSARDFDNVKGGGDLGRLDPSDGRERNWDFSGEWKVADGRFVRLTVHDVHRDHMKRYYRPTQDNVNDREAFALSYREEGRRDGPWDEMEVRIYRQKKVDERRFFDTAAKGEAITETWQGNLRFTRDVGCGHVLTVGLQTELTDGDSPDDEQFTFVVPSPKRRDAPLSDWDDFAVYVQDEWEACETVSITGSARYDYQVFETRVDDAYVPPLGNPQDDEIRDTVDAVTGGLGVVYRASDEVRVTGSYARGFRQNAPNFGLRQLGDGILIPNALLDPTTSDNFELGLKTRCPGAHFEGSVYYSMIDNWQGDLRPTLFRGRSFLDFNRNGTRDANEGFVQQVEGGEAWVKGIELGGGVQLDRVCDSIPPNWSVWGSFAYNKGEVDPTKANPMKEWMRHTQPMRGLVGVRWDDVDHPSRGLYFEAVVDMVDRFDRIPSDRRMSDLAWRRDPQDGTSPLLRSYVGTPGYTIFHVYAGVRIGEHATLRVGVENVTDKKYRAAHSRSDAPGLNVLASLELTF